MAGENRITMTASIAQSTLLAVMAIALCCTPANLSQAQPRSKPSSAPSPRSAQKLFATPKEAADSPVQAAANFDVSALLEILGPGAKDLVAPEDQVEDRNLAVAFAAKARENNRLIIDAKNPDRAVLTVAAEDCPLPIPLVKTDDNW